MRRSAYIGTLALLVACPPALQAGGLPPSTVTRIEALSREFLERKASDTNAPTALSSAIGANGDLVLAGGFGQATATARADAATLYHVGSITKQFVAASVLKLSARPVRSVTTGQVMTIDSPISLFFEHAGRWGGEHPVTVRQLLTMTSNLPNFTRRPPRDIDPWGAVTAQQLLDKLQQQEPHGLGNSFEYSNTNYFLLAAILEAVVEPGARSSKRYRDILADEIFRPAGMSDTRFIGDDLEGRVLASPHYSRDRPAFNSADWLKGSADVVSNAVDIFAWNKALMDGRILSPALKAEMFADSARVGPVQYYGMGWFIEHGKERDLFFHSGTVPGYAAYNLIAVDPETSRWFCVVLLANSDAVQDLDGLAASIIDTLVE